MKKLCILMTLLLLSNCRCTQPSAKPVQVITQIQVTGTENGHSWHKTFSEPEEMDAIVLLLRQLKPGQSVDIAPESFRTDAYELVVTYSDGSHTVYRQILHHYLQIDDADYRQIREASAARLAQLLKELPADHAWVY